MYNKLIEFYHNCFRNGSKNNSLLINSEKKNFTAIEFFISKSSNMNYTHK